MLEPQRDIMSTVSRRFFIDEFYNVDHMKDSAIPIGCGVNTTKPKQIEEMLLLLGHRNKVLEIGTGCGWQTALLTGLCDDVYSIEVSRKLYERASFNLKGYDVQLKYGNGLEGWKDKAPFDGIILCAAVEEINNELLDQLNEGGVIIAPIGDEKRQVITRVTKTESGVSTEEFNECGFIVAKQLLKYKEH